MIELAWWALVLLILATIIIYTFLLLVVYKGFVKGQKGRFLFNLPLAPFSVKSRMYTISKQLGVDEEDVKYVGDNVYKVNETKYTVEGFFGVVVYQLDDNNNIKGSVLKEVSEINLSNLRVESGEVDPEATKNN